MWRCWCGELESWRITLTLKLRGWSLLARWAVRGVQTSSWQGESSVSPLSVPPLLGGARREGGRDGGGHHLAVRPRHLLAECEWQGVTCTNIGASIPVVWPLLSLSVVGGGGSQSESAVTDPILQYTDTRPWWAQFSSDTRQARWEWESLSETVPNMQDLHLHLNIVRRFA